MQKRIPLYKWMVELNFAIFNEQIFGIYVCVLCCSMIN
nr:MAG TPA: hypothetical protein [Inoviridae sp.]